MARALLCRLLLLLNAFLPKRPMAVVLMYHRIGKGSLYAVPFDTLRKHITALQHRGFRFVHASTISTWSPKQGNVCALTFDDGYGDNIVVKDLGVPATIFVTTDPLPEEVGVEKEAFGGRTLVETLAKAAVEVGAHGVTHRRWTKLVPQELEKELRDAKKTLEEWSGTVVATCAYPKGALNDAVKAKVKTMFASAFLADGAAVQERIQDHLAIPRIGIFGNTSMAEFQLRTSPLFTFVLRLWKAFR